MKPKSLMRRTRFPPMPLTARCCNVLTRLRCLRCCQRRFATASLRCTSATFLTTSLLQSCSIGARCATAGCHTSGFRHCPSVCASSAVRNEETFFPRMIDADSTKADRASPLERFNLASTSNLTCRLLQAALSGAYAGRAPQALQVALLLIAPTSLLPSRALCAAHRCMRNEETFFPRMIDADSIKADRASPLERFYLASTSNLMPLPCFCSAQTSCHSRADAWPSKRRFRPAIAPSWLR